MAPLQQRIRDARVWVIASPGSVTVLAQWEPVAAELESWLALAHDLAAALRR